MNLDDILMVFEKTSGSTAAHYTKDLSVWSKITLGTQKITGVYSTGGGYINNGSETELIFLTTDSISTLPYATDGKTNQQTVSSLWSTSGTKSPLVVATVSPELGILLVSSNNSIAKKVKGVSGFSRHNLSFIPLNGGNTGLFTNQNGLAWSPVHQVFCIVGKNGVETSSDGENWTVHTDVPKNLTDLTYREDLEVFFARCLDYKLFYASGDGITWQAVTSTPIPLETVSCVDFCAETGIYCAVGGTGRYAYFSKDLTTWVATTITNGAEITAGSVIYMPSTKKYVLMPTSGSYYYTFDASEWVN